MNSIMLPTVNFEKYLNITQEERKIIHLVLVAIKQHCAIKSSIFLFNTVPLFISFPVQNFSDSSILFLLQ